MEDTPASGSDFDYNDVVIKFAPVPEPASVALMGGGILLLGVVMQRRRK